MADKPELEGYVEVHARIQAFLERYPEGSLRCGKWRIEEVGERTFIVYQALAYRTPDDKRPGEGWAWEPFPGLTPWTLNSELMNAETSAWGRALAALGFEVHRGIASANEVRARSGTDGGDGPPPSDKQLGFLRTLLVRENKVGEAQALDILDYCKATMTGGRGGSVSAVIDALKDKKRGAVDKLITDAGAWKAEQPVESDVPADTEGLPEVDDEGRVVEEEGALL